MRSFLVRKINNFTKMLSLRAKVPNTYGTRLYIVNEGKNAHFLLNFTVNKIKLAQIMNNRVNFVRNTCYFDVQ